MHHGLGRGNMLGTAAKVAGAAAVGGMAYGAYRHYKAGGFGQGGPGLFGGDAATGAASTPGPQAQALNSPFAGAQQGGGASPFAGGQQGGGASPFAGGQQGGGASPFAGGQQRGASPFAGAQQGGGGASPVAGGQQAGASSFGAPVQPPQVHKPPQLDQEAQALLLVRAMIAAAYIDGRLDPQERANIVKAAEGAGLGASERAALEHELAHPHKVNVLLGAVDDPELAKQVYLVTLLAVDNDNAIEQAYVAGLPIYLGLSPADVTIIHQHLFGTGGG